MQRVQGLATSMQAYQYIMLHAEHEPMVLHITALANSVKVFRSSTMQACLASKLVYFSPATKLQTCAGSQNMAEARALQAFDLHDAKAPIRSSCNSLQETIVSTGRCCLGFLLSHVLSNPAVW